MGFSRIEPVQPYGPPCCHWQCQINYKLASPVLPDKESAKCTSNIIALPCAFLQAVMAPDARNPAYGNREVSLAPSTLGLVDDSAAVARYVDVDATDPT